MPVLPSRPQPSVALPPPPLLILVLALLGVLAPPMSVAAWNISLRITSHPSGARGGEPFDTQPAVEVYDRRGGETLQTSFVGRVTAHVHGSDDDGEKKWVPLWRQGEPTPPVPASPSDAPRVSEDVVDGRASFVGLGIDAAGIGYRMEYTLYDEHGLVMATAIGEDEFDVEVGEKYRLDIATRPEMAYGGSAFGSQPVLAVRDRGGNVVADANEGTVTVSLQNGPAGSALRCADGDAGFSVPVRDGLASFRGLFINEANVRYSLHFRTDISLDGGSEVASDDFTVGVGPASRIALINDASDGPAAWGGMAFAPQPRAEVRDAGGNVIVDDLRSAVRVSFYSNPSGGKLSSSSSPAGGGGTTEILDRGVVQFRGLSIDRAGVGYRLTYEFLQYEDERLKDTSIVAHGSYFDVEIGPPHRLSIVRHSSGAWAGNQPFPVQPKVALLDAGGNVVVGDSTSTVTAHLTPSLARVSRVVIDTSNDPVPFVTEVIFAQSTRDDERLLYGPGDAIWIDVMFSQEVTLFRTVDGGALPQLVLNAIDSEGADAVYAELIVPIQEGSFSRIVSFKYVVDAGHSQTELDYSSTNSFRANDCTVEDAFGRGVDLNLPAAGSGSSLSTSRAIGISDDRPVVESIAADLVTGEYGAGDEVNFVVTLDREVSVIGMPMLPLNIRSLIAVVDISTSGAIHPGSYYNMVYKGEASDRILWNASASEVRDAMESMEGVAGKVCVSRAPSPNSLSAAGFRWAIRFDDVGDSIFEVGAEGVGLDFIGSSGSVTTNFVTANAVSGGWITDDGDESMCTARAVAYVEGSGTKSLGFKFRVLPGDAATRLDALGAAGAELLFPTPEDSISLLINSPGTSLIKVDPNIEGMNLPMDQTISIDTTPPSVVDIRPQETTTPSGTYAVGDPLFFEVIFDKPVEVDIGLELSLNTDNGVARYISGSGTETLLLQYVVKEGDLTSSLDFRDSSPLLSHNTEGGRLPVFGHVRRKSHVPLTDANLDVSHISSMTLAHAIVIDGERPTMLDVLFHDNDKGNAFARGDTLTILVEFSAAVVVNESSPPILGLLVGDNERWAIYTSGSGSSTLNFAYEVLVGDSSMPLDLLYRRICHQSRDCINTDGLVERLSATLELDADLDTGFSEQGILIAESPESGVTIDTSLSPVTTVVMVTSPKIEGTYGVGEIVDIQVQFTDQVFLPGAAPALLLNTLNADNSAAYHAGQGSDTLTFRYISTEFDFISRLDWAFNPSTSSAITCTGACRIENANRVDVDVRFHDPESNSDLVGPLEPAIAFNPSPAQIVSVNSDKMKSPYCHPTCTYTIGEEIDIYVTFDRPVVVRGTDISLLMDVGDSVQDSRAVYVPSRSTENELMFLYIVGHGHSTDGKSLNYLCPGSSCILQLGGATEVKGASSIPTTDADLTLPPCSNLGLSGDALNPVIVDTSGHPHVVDVSSITADGEYGPGDIIEISVEFSRAVEVSGDPFVTLNTGTSQSGIAIYKSGSGTSTLLFEYEVGLDHMTLDLEYVDSHSLQLGHDGVISGSIKQSSSNPSIDANLELSFPGAAGSLGTNTDLRIDSRKPFISSLSSVPGEYSMGDVIVIHVEFSRPVSISRSPSLVLKTGIVDRIAEYEYQPKGSSLEFSYTVQLGDATESLDYWSDEQLFPSSTLAFRLNGGSIKLQGTNPVLDADLHINPIDGFLDGVKQIEVTEGVALFRDLKIGQRGKDFKIWFQSSVPSTGGQLQVAEAVKVDPSIEYEVRGDLMNRDPGDLYGSAVSLHEDMLAVGAPGKLNPTPDIQVLTVCSEAAIEEHEVQIVATSVNKREAVISSQEFSTCADAGETISGSFTLTYNIDGTYAFASPLELDSDVGADQLKSVLENELELVGLISTSRSDNPACVSHNSWMWSVTFLDSSEGVGVLETNGDLLIGNGALISQAVLKRDVEMLRGSFRLVNPFNDLISRDISYDASGIEVKAAIQEDLAITVLSVQAENMDPHNKIPELGRRWTIIFSHHVAEYGRDNNVPELQAISEGLLGKDSHVWTHTGFEGRGVLSGSFALSFRGSDPSYFLSHDVSIEEMAAALESLDSINKVSVSNRRMFSNEVGKCGFSWTITFDSVNKSTDYGWLLDPGGTSSNGNLPTLKVTSHLIGWKAGYLVQSETGRGEEDTQAQWMTQEKGDDGSGSGSVEIFRHTQESWIKEATVLAADYDSNDAFGASVSISDDFLLVGAPSKEVNGLPEQQSMTCTGSASGGVFFVSFRGFTSSAIPYDAKLIDIKNSIIGLYGGTYNIHTTPRLIFASQSEGWDGFSSGFCNGSEVTISITFLTPDGGGISTAKKRSDDLELLTVDSSNLIGASISVKEHQVGTMAAMGKDLDNSQPTGKQAGSAYLFQRHLSCSYCEPVWTQVTKFTPLEGLDHPTDAAEFGSSSVFVPGAGDASSLVIVGSPGFFHGSGKVYIFHFTHGSWVPLDSLSDQNWNHEGVKGALFGSSLDADSGTILVGSPGHSNGKGAVYIFRCSSKGKPFLASQAIYGPDDLQEGDHFGHSVALSNNKAVICAPYKSTSAVHPGLPQNPERVGTGACFVYSRQDTPSAFKLDQKLDPSNTLADDRFGWSVAISSNRIVVGQVEEMAGGNIDPPRPVQVIKTFCHPPCKNAGASSFRLRWIDTISWTPFLSASSTSANQMRDAIESSLLSFGAASVSRSVLPDEDGGHIWHITFDSHDSVFRGVNKIPPIECEVFVTSSLSCKTFVLHDIPRNIRGKAHLFDFDESGEIWTEQSFLFSNAPQHQDLLGTSVAIDGNYAASGAPNRELLNVNSGAALVYDISFLDLNFPDGPYLLTEGDVLDINIERVGSSFHRRQVVSLRTMDPNADDDLQHYVSELFSLQSLALTSHDKTPVELVTRTTAMGRSQYYGSSERRSLFVKGMYDVLGINDYELLEFEGQFNKGEQMMSTQFRTTDDSILEMSEQISFQINLRGMFASQLGRLKANITINENGDGISREGNVQYQVLDSHINEESSRMGVAVGIERSAGMIVVGSDHATGVDASGNQLRNVGCANIFKRSASGSWDFIEALSPPIEEVQANINFGESVAISKAYGREDITVLIGAPGIAAAFVYAYESSTSSWTLQAKLSANDATLSVEDRFGGQAAIALHEDMAFVGSSSMEQVYVFRRSHVDGKGFVRWNPYSILRSNDYDFDVYGDGFSIKHKHKQGFGLALAASHRTLLVGAPYANYGNRGDVNDREHFDTDGTHNEGLGTGKVFSFFSQPHVQIVALQSDEKITAGSFTLKFSNHQGVLDDLSRYIRHNSAPGLFKVAIEEMVSVGEVKIEAKETIESQFYEVSWRISFLSNFADTHPTLIPQWYGNGCDGCEKFKVSVLSTVEPFITVTSTHSHQPYIQEGEMQPRDATSTDLFGASIAIDGPQAIVGSMRSAAKTRTTWDFETGNLVGWSATGSAFQFQPTFGDNSKFRAVYEGYGSASSHTSGEPQSSRLEGRYYVATFDQRSSSDGNYLVPNQKSSLGSTQGDRPTGTLTSDPFIILGSNISFLIGGGCNHLTIFVELLVDGYPSLRATGKCSERMDRVFWHVGMFMGRAGQIRIVDNGSNKWDHINVDDINFSWDMTGTCLANNFGQCTEGGGALPKMSKSETEKQHYTGREESPMSGAAYMFLYDCEETKFSDFLPSNSKCKWVEEERLVASDKRQANLFGISVDVDHEQGLAVVGSPNSPSYGFYQEPVSVHPHSNRTIDLPIPESLEDLMKSGGTYSATSGNIRLTDYLIDKGLIAAEKARIFTQQSGAVYVYLREPAKFGPSGEVINNSFWRTTEHSKFSPPDVMAGNNFGFSVALGRTPESRDITAVVGATGRDSHAKNGGSAFVYDMEWVRVKFTKVEFVALESDRVVKIFVERELPWSDSRFSLGYSTSDLTAVGVDTIKYDDCMSTPSLERDGCGDYEQSSGEVTFNPGEQNAYFTIRIIDDACNEQNMEYIQLNLHQLGGSPLRGENFRAQLRIDDDDWASHALSMNCTGGIM